MYGMIIVDDRADVVKSIEKLGNWNELNVDVVGTAANGAEAVELIKSLKPKIIITDIKMPIMDGLELTRQAKEIDNSIKIILLSGYDDFAYAQKAINIGVQEYLLKPAKIEHIREAVCRVINQILMEERKFYEDMKLRQKLKESMPLLREEYLKFIIKNPIKLKDKMKEKLNYLGIDLGVENFRVMVILLDDYETTINTLSLGDYDLLIFSIINIVEETVMGFEKSVVFKSGTEEVSVILNAEVDTDTMFNVAELCTERIKKYLEWSVSIGIGRYYKEPNGIILSYREALKAVQNRFITGKNSIINIDNIDIIDKVHFEYPYESSNELLQYMGIGAVSKAEEVCGLFIEELQTNNKGFPELIKKYLVDYISVISRELIVNGISIDDIVGDEIECMHKLEAYNTMDEISNELKGIVNKVSNYIYSLKKANEQSNIEEIINYLDNNYNRSNISLNEISKKFYISPSYLSTIIKEHIGDTFIERITRLRMERAKILLLSSEEKVYEVAEKVGYTDRRYFSDIFKKYTGLTPKEYTQKYKS